MTASSVDGAALKAAFARGTERLARHADEINRLNVFPVPDGDTGINMRHTLQRARQEIAALDSGSAGLVAARFAHGALMGARGNSGTILSQLLRGFADSLGDAAILTPSLLLPACEAAVERAYASVSQPTEGTILTVARQATEALRSLDLEKVSVKRALETLVCAARTAVADSPNLLPVLHEAGVVDAGGMGLLRFLQGIAGDDAIEAIAPAVKANRAAPPLFSPTESFGYDVQYLMLGDGLDIKRIRRDLEAMGDSVIVAGDRRALKIHLHVQNPALPLDYAIRAGATLDDIVVENMQLQSLRRPTSEPAPIRERAVIAVSEGDGMRRVFLDLSCDAVLTAGPGAKPATEDFLRAIKNLRAETVIILPNDKDIVMAAQAAAEHCGKARAQVVPTASVQQGLCAMIAFGDAGDSQADLAATVARMGAACAEVVSIEITRASRSTRLGGLDIVEGEFIAIVDGQLRACAPELEAVAGRALDAVDAPEREFELATVYYGADMSASEAETLVERLACKRDDLEFEVVYGGQTLYPILIGLE